MHSKPARDAEPDRQAIGQAGQPAGERPDGNPLSLQDLGEVQPGVHVMLEACRPGSEDLQDPSLSLAAAALCADVALRKRVAALQRFDQALGAALRGVAVPAGLKDRLLAAVAQFANEAPGDAAERIRHAPAPQGAHAMMAANEQLPCGGRDTPTPTYGDAAATFAAGQQSPSGPLPSVSLRRHTLRRWLVGCMAMAAAACLLCWIGMAYLWRQQQPTLNDVVNDAYLHMRKQNDAESWKPFDRQRPRGFPSSFKHISLRGDVRWCYCRLGAVRAVVYDVTLNQVKGALYVVPTAELGTAAPKLPTAPGQPVFTQGCSSSTWREGDYVCLLIVEGDERALHRLLRQMPPVTQREPEGRMLAGTSIGIRPTRQNAGLRGKLPAAARGATGRRGVPAGRPRERGPG